MSKLQELIRELCPDGVEYKMLGEVSEFRAGWGFPESEQGKTDGKYPFYKVSDMNSSDVFMDVANNYISEEISIKLRCKPAPKGTIIFPKIGATMGTNKKRILTKDSCYDNNVMGLIAKSSVINGMFLYYYFSRFKLMDFAKGTGAVPSLDTNKLKRLLIPIPPLEVQNEIVRIFDHFTNLAAELQAELQARKEQYEYYRNKLLAFDKTGTQSVTWMKMSEIGTFIRGKRFVRTDIVNDGIPCIHYGDIYTYYGLYATKSKGSLRSELASRMRYAQKNDVVIVAAGENKEDIGIGLAWLGEKPAAVHDACFIFRSDLYPQYISHYLRSNYYHKQIIKYVSEGKICSISAKGLGNAIIPIPSYEEQVRIATLLNNFDVLVSDLSQDLPAEIAAVQEQYEYYRNKILSFPRIRIGA